jgi:Cu-processing system permease protein
VSGDRVWRTIRLCAEQELTLALRSRWIQLFAIVFGGLALAIATSGYVLSGGSGMQDFARTAASLLQLVLLIVPLATLVMGVLALTPERGGAELLFAQPVRREAVLSGMLLGLFEALTAAQAVGFGAAGVIIFLQVGNEGVAGFLLVGGSSVLLTAVFLALAALISVGQTGRKRVRALSWALVTWCALALVFDIGVLGLATLLRSGHSSRLLVVSALINPIDAVRTGTLLGLEGTAAFGPASLALLRLTGGPEGTAALIGLSLALWIVVPAGIAMRRLTRIDIL